MKNALVSLIVATSLICTASPNQAQASDEQYKTNVTEAEWDAAIPLTKDLGITLKLLKGQRATPASKRRPGQSSHATISVVVRVDGTVGVYKVVETNDPSYARDFIKTLLKQKYAPPVLNGKPVSLRGDEYQVITFDR
jgi:hypothetical protein